MNSSIDLMEKATNFRFYFNDNLKICEMFFDRYHSKDLGRANWTSLFWPEN